MSKAKNVSAWWGKTSWWIAGGVVFIIAVLAIILLVNPAKKNDATANGANPVAVATKTAAAGCNVPVGDTSSKPAMPKDLRWAAAKGWTWPVSDTYGPTQTKNGYGTCFARSPLGAALTAVTFNATANTLKVTESIDLYIMDSPGKDVSLSTLGQDSLAGAPAVFAGFSVDSFTPDEAQITVVIATQTSTTGYAGIPETFRWVDGDWKLKVLDDGRFMTGPATYPVAGQFVKWAGIHG